MRGPQLRRPILSEVENGNEKRMKIRRLPFSKGNSCGKLFELLEECVVRLPSHEKKLGGF